MDGRGEKRSSAERAMKMNRRVCERIDREQRAKCSKCGSRMRGTVRRTPPTPRHFYYFHGAPRRRRVRDRMKASFCLFLPLAR